MLYKDKTGTDDLRFIVANRSDGDIKGVNTKNASGLLSFTVTSDIINKLIIGFSGSTDNSVTLLAAKLELGDTQTLAHKENGVWVLNEIPDFGEQLRRCCASFSYVLLRLKVYLANTTAAPGIYYPTSQYRGFRPAGYGECW